MTKTTINDATYIRNYTRDRNRAGDPIPARPCNIVLIKNDEGRFCRALVCGVTSGRWVELAFEYKFGGVRELPPGVDPVQSDCDFSFPVDIEAACEQAALQWAWYGFDDHSCSLSSV